jgi:hypothetical protein
MGSPGFWAKEIRVAALLGHWFEKLSRNVPWISFVAFYGILANVPYWFASREFGFLQIGLFCLQYLTVGLLGLFIPRFLSATLLLAIIFADLLDGVCASFSLPVAESLENLGVVHALSGTRLTCATAAFLLAALVVATSLFLPGNTLPKNQRRRAAVCLLAFGLVIVGADISSIRLATGYLPPSLRSSKCSDGVDMRVSQFPRLARIPVIRLVRAAALEGALRRVGEISAASAVAVPSATEVAVHHAGIMSGDGSRERPNLVLVVVESWGVAVNSPLRNALVEPYLQPNLLSEYQVVQGSVPFAGSTIPGEARELCGSSFGFHLLNATASELNSCLPHRLAALGYYNIALHGMNGHIFRRSEWYRTIGFQETWFHERFKQQGMPDCMGAFIGTCDADIAAWIGRRLEEDSPQPYFIHWMTLSSHLPVLVPVPHFEGAPCLADDSLSPNTPLCSWYQLVANVHQSIAQLAEGNLARPTVFVIVGDHAPPFADPALRARFSPSDVPYVILLPRSDRGASRTLLAHNTANPHPRAAKSPRQTP